MSHERDPKYICGRLARLDTRGARTCNLGAVNASDIGTTVEHGALLLVVQEFWESRKFDGAHESSWLVLTSQGTLGWLWSSEFNPILSGAR